MATVNHTRMIPGLLSRPGRRITVSSVGSMPPEKVTAHQEDHPLPSEPHVRPRVKGERMRL